MLNKVTRIKKEIRFSGYSKDLKGLAERSVDTLAEYLNNKTRNEYHDADKTLLKAVEANAREFIRRYEEETQKIRGAAVVELQNLLNALEDNPTKNKAKEIISALIAFDGSNRTLSEELKEINTAFALSLFYQKLADIVEDYSQKFNR